MRHSKEFQTIDGVADPDDQVQIETQERQIGTTLYIHVNGQTLLRLGRVSQDAIHYIHNGKAFSPKVPKADYVGLDDLRERFKQAVGGLPNYKRTDAWSYIAALELVIQHKDKQIAEMAEHSSTLYEQGERAGMSRARSKPGDGDMGG